MNIGDRVTRKWKPALGEGTILHILGDKIVVRWSGLEKPTIHFEKPEHLRALNENR